MAYKRNVEIFEESYEKKDSKSVLSYVSRDGRKEIERACDVILKENKGFTYSNPDLRMSLMCISRVTSIDQWFDSMSHEVDHLQWEIMQYYDVDPGTEEAAWLQGYIVRMIIKAIAR